MPIKRITHLNGKVTYRATVGLRGGASKTMEFSSAKDAREWLAQHGEILANPGSQARRFLIGFLSVFAIVGGLVAAGINYIKSDEFFGRMLDANTHYQQDAACRILFIGNSHLFNHNVPKLVNAMSRSTLSTADDCPVEMIAEPSWTLANHWHNQPTQNAIRTGAYRQVVLQEQSTVVLFPRESEISILAFKSLIRLIKANVMQPVIMQTWARDAGSSLYSAPDFEGMQYPRTPNEMAVRVHDFYAALEAEQNAPVAYVGDYWNFARWRSPYIALYGNDDSHASLAGAYLAALVLHKTLFSSSMGEITFVPDGLNAKDAAVLRDHVARPAKQVKPGKSARKKHP